MTIPTLTIWTSKSGNYKEVEQATRINATRDKFGMWSMWNADGKLEFVPSDSIESFMKAEARKAYATTESK